MFFDIRSVFNDILFLFSIWLVKHPQQHSINKISTVKLTLIDLVHVSQATTISFVLIFFFSCLIYPFAYCNREKIKTVYDGELCSIFYAKYFPQIHFFTISCKAEAKKIDPQTYEKWVNFISIEGALIIIRFLLHI